MKTTTRYLVLLFVLIQGFLIPAVADTENTLVVHLKNGTQTTFVLKEKPQVRFVNGNLEVVSETTNASVTFAMTELQRFTFVSQDPSGINDPVVKPAGISMQEDGVLVISQIRKDGIVSIYSTDGKLVKLLKAQHAGTYRLNLSSLSKGVYIVKADNLTYKISKR